MSTIKITKLSLLPEDELFQKSMEYWLKTIALTFAVDVNAIPRRELSAKELLEELKDLEPAMNKLQIIDIR